MTKLLKFLLPSILLALFSTPLFATGGFNLLDSLGGEDDILEPDEAFQISYDSQPGEFRVSWLIAEGHYLYRDKIKITADDTSVSAKPLIMPAGEAKDDPVFNKTLYVFHHSADAALPYQYNHNGDKEVTFKVKYQGCSEISGICYPPQTKQFTVKLSPIPPAMAATRGVTDSNTTEIKPETLSEQDEIADALRSGDNWLTLIIFLQPVCYWHSHPAYSR